MPIENEMKEKKHFERCGFLVRANVNVFKKMENLFFVKHSSKTQTLYKNKRSNNLNQLFMKKLHESKQFRLARTDG